MYFYESCVSNMISECLFQSTKTGLDFQVSHVHNILLFLYHIFRTVTCGIQSQASPPVFILSYWAASSQGLRSLFSDSGAIVWYCRCVCDSGSSLAIIIDSSLTSLLWLNSIPLNTPPSYFCTAFWPNTFQFCRTLKPLCDQPQHPPVLYSLTALLPFLLAAYVHLSGVSFRPHIHQQRPHIKRGYSRLGSDIITSQVFVQEPQFTMHSCRSLLAPGMKSSCCRVSLSWLLSSTDIPLLFVISTSLWHYI